MKTSSLHLLAEYWECNRTHLDDIPFLDQALRAAAEAAGVEVLTASFHHFHPQGVSGVLMIAESHLSIHTWPEAGYAAVDLYTCGNGNPEAAHEVLQRALESQRHDRVLLRRGDARPPRILRGHIDRAAEE